MSGGLRGLVARTQCPNFFVDLRQFDADFVASLDALPGRFFPLVCNPRRFCDFLP